ncbi:uncharacterized protein LOC115003546 isoform X2 [Cottoperca gobio]|uniref:Uncharacterized protein LOC115003546 isoform X2 n=1 Tax=Cottoperca gobio TaxID=56716 RepID=A0A6J2P7B2_COTGO|nr:uncharacterized protein LOC115003546 isoform X2 [Cottoperca gobio]
MAEMADLRRIKMYLFLILLLQFTAVIGQNSSSLVVSDGDEVTLPCENVIDDQNKCDGTYWIFSGPGSTLSSLLLNLGQIGDNYKAKSDRLSVTEKCSLVIKKVTVHDVGRYTCRQITPGQQDAHVSLSLITMTEHHNNDQVTLNCSVSSSDWCRHTVEWLYEGKDMDENVETSQSECSVTVTLPRRKKKRQKSKYHELKCEVTDFNSGNVQLFPFLQSSATLPAISDTSTPHGINSHGWGRVIVVSVVLATLIMIVVAVNIWARTKKNKTQMDDNAVHYDGDEDEDTVVYEDIGDPSVRLH